MLKSGRFYKVGRTNDLGRREYEIGLQLPEKATTVHTIRTDDPVGIEAYWHKRFAERRKNGGAQLSGGEQQMLAIGRILRTGATLLLLDEPTEGLAPVIVQQIGATIRKLKEEGLTILLVEQNFRFAQTVADRHYVMENGRVIDMIPNADLEANMQKIHEYLGV